MQNSKKLLIVMIVLVGAVVFNSCDKQEIPKNDIVAKTSVKDYLNILNAFSLSTVEEITSGNDDDLKSAEIVDCLTVTIHPNDSGTFWPRSWTLDYGTENCGCYFGIERRGKIHVSLSDWWRNEGSFREITFEDYYFNDNKLEGVKTFLNTGLNDNGNITFTKNVSDAQITYGDTATMSWNSEKYSELIEGGESFIFADDVWSVTGGGSGVNVDGKDYSFTIESALIYHNKCYFPVSGAIKFVIDGEEDLVINYGNGECDEIATAKVGDGEEETIEL